MTRETLAPKTCKRVMRWFKCMFAPHVVVMSEPYEDGVGWSYLFGDKERYELRKFPAADEAYKSYKATLLGLGMGSPEISIKLIRLNVDQVRGVSGEASYRALIDSRL